VRLRIGTRRSRLALAQAEEVAGRLRAAGFEAELVPMLTSGDRGARADLSKAGLKGLFVAEIVRALQAGEVDLAVHSAKDLPSEDPAGVVVAAVPPRAPAFDVLVTRDGELPEGGTIGTSSLRRRALLRSTTSYREPRARFADLRGNVDTRLRKLAEGEVDGLVLAAAGLLRLGLWPGEPTALPPGGAADAEARLDASAHLEAEGRPHARPVPIVPAPGQGCLAVQARADDARAREAAALLDDAASRDALAAERAVVRALGGGCALPLGARAHREPDGRLFLAAIVATPDGDRVAAADARGGEPAAVAAQVVARLRARGADEILARARGEG
jgi:hydroxymethylbilane synthase